jgi:hypothetical protein
MIEQQSSHLKSMLEEALSRTLESVKGISEEDAHEAPMEGEWSVCELLAHISEIQDFWSDKAILITSSDDPNITRTEVENDIRSAAVQDHSGDSIPDLLHMVRDANQNAIQKLLSISFSDLDRPGHRGEDNPITTRGVFEYLSGHIAEHARQILETRKVIESG